MWKLFTRERQSCLREREEERAFPSHNGVKTTEWNFTTVYEKRCSCVVFCPAKIGHHQCGILSGVPCWYGKSPVISVCVCDFVCVLFLVDSMKDKLFRAIELQTAFLRHHRMQVKLGTHGKKLFRVWNSHYRAGWVWVLLMYVSAPLIWTTDKTVAGGALWFDSVGNWWSLSDIIMMHVCLRTIPFFRGSVVMLAACVIDEAITMMKCRLFPEYGNLVGHFTGGFLCI